MAKQTVLIGLEKCIEPYHSEFLGIYIAKSKDELREYFDQISREKGIGIL